MSKKVYNRMTEEQVAKDPFYSYYYARDVIKGRFPLGEKEITKDAYYCRTYIEYVLIPLFHKERAFL